MGPRGVSGDPNQPTQRAMLLIKNKNNITDLKLRKTLEKFEREKAVRMYNIDHDRLDVKDFLREVKYCASDALPESKLWLGEKEEERKRKEEEKRKRASTAPGDLGAKQASASGQQRDIQTALDRAPDNDPDVVQFGIFLKKRKDLDPNRVHQDIYSRRNMYSSIERDVKTQEQREHEEKLKEEQLKKWQEEQERQAREEEERKAKEKKEQEEKKRKELEERRQKALEAQRAAMLAEEKDSNEGDRIDIKAEMRRIACVREPTDLEKREARIRSMNANADLMKEILMQNAKKRSERKKKRAVPVEDRIREFLGKIETLRKSQAEANAAGPTLEQQRRFILMTKGVKAALEFAAEEEEDNPLNTY